MKKIKCSIYEVREVIEEIRKKNFEIVRVQKNTIIFGSLGRRAISEITVFYK